MITHVTGYSEWSGYLSTGVSGAQADVTVADSGTATVTSAVEDHGMDANGDATLVNSDGSDAGDIDWKMSGDYCQSYSDLLGGG